MGYMCVFQFSFPKGICLGVGLLGHMVILFLVFQGISILSSFVALLLQNLPAMRGTWFWSLDGEDPLEKGKATHSSILAWRISWTIQSMDTTGHDWGTFTFTSLSYHLPQWLYQFAFAPTVQECSPFSTLSAAFIVCRLFNDGHSDWCEAISHCSFDLHFSDNERCWASFHVFVSHLYVWKISV